VAGVRAMQSAQRRLVNARQRERHVAAMRIAPLAALALAACATHLLPQRYDHLKIDWQRDYSAARARAAAENKPLLVVLAAGDIKGLC
jgi:hypothetical protein